MSRIIAYETESGHCPIKDYISKLAKQGKTNEIAQITLCQKRLQDHGMAVNNFYPQTIRKIGNDIYELRPGPNRIFFFYFTGDSFVLLHAYRKHGQKAPTKEIDQAEREMKDYIRRSK